jgi:hypothetical protein
MAGRKEPSQWPEDREPSEATVSSRSADGEPKKALVFNYTRIREVCDVEGFLKTPVDAAL